MEIVFNVNEVSAKYSSEVFSAIKDCFKKNGNIESKLDEFVKKYKVTKDRTSDSSNIEIYLGEEYTKAPLTVLQTFATVECDKRLFPVIMKKIPDKE